MKTVLARASHIIVAALLTIRCLGWPADPEQEKEVQRLKRKAEGCFKIGEDEAERGLNKPRSTQ